MLTYAQIAQNIIDAHPESVHQLLMAKGISKKATPDVLKNTYVLFGKPFISELTNIVYSPKKSDFSNVSGTTTLEESVATGTEKKTIWNSLANIFDSVVNVSNKVGSVSGQVSSTAQTAKDIVQPANGQPNIFQSEEKKALEEAENRKFTKKILIVSGIVIIVLISLIVITRKK